MNDDTKSKKYLRVLCISLVVLLMPRKHEQSY